jgi:hypothetical protein
MYNPKDIQFVGKHDYDKEEALKYAAWNGKSFSVNIFRWVLKSNGKSMKKGKGIVRVSGSPKIKEKIFEYCGNIVKDLDNGNWDGRKTVSVK